MSATFKPGNNIAIKVPSHEFHATVAFYGEILAFAPVERNTDSASRAFAFGDKILWIDPTPGISQAEIWLEIITDNLNEASAHFTHNRCVRCDEIERLPDGLQAFWISGPGNIIHLIAKDSGA